MRLKASLFIDEYLGSLLLSILKPIWFIFHRVLKRDHKLIPRKDIYFIKLLGGGSLVIALPTLLGIKKSYPNQKLLLITTPSILPFAKFLGIFDDYLIIDQSSIWSLLRSGFCAWKGCFRCDTIIDLEVHSKMTSVLTVLSAARNRIGFYTDSLFWTEGFYTHPIFLNRFSGIYYFYDQIASMVDTPTLSQEECRKFVVSHSSLKTRIEKLGDWHISVGVGCSNLSMERMLSAPQWADFILSRLKKSNHPQVNLSFLGGKEDRKVTQEVIDQVSDRLAAAGLNISINNYCGQLKLHESLEILYQSNDYWGIDSSLLHFARLFGVKSVSFWGPTHPEILLRPSSHVEEEIFYRRLPCSPCVHVVHSPPCGGNNECMQKLRMNSTDEFKTNPHNNPSA